MWNVLDGLNPMKHIFKDWEGMHHIDMGGNCKFLTKDSVDEIKDCIWNIYNDKFVFNNMKQIATERCIKEFAYSNIAKKAININ